MVAKFVIDAGKLQLSNYEPKTRVLQPYLRREDLFTRVTAITEQMAAPAMLNRLQKNVHVASNSPVAVNIHHDYNGFDLGVLAADLYLLVEPLVETKTTHAEFASRMNALTLNIERVATTNRK